MIGVLRILGVLLLSLAVAMLPSLAIGLGEGLGVAWLIAFSIPAVLGWIIWRLTPRDITVDHRTGLLVVGLAWISVVTVGSVPFITTGVAPNVVQAFFESVSGFTTTGATVFPVIESLPQSILLWRSVSHWLGGMGIIVLGVAILPFLGVGGAQLFRAEAPGISNDRLTPRIASTARLLWGVYAGLTGVLALLYLVLGMSFFDAINHAMSTLATGGFSTKTTSMADFSSAIQWVTCIFMFLAGVNFALHLRMFSGQWKTYFRDVEWRVYAILVLGSLALCTVALVDVRGFTVGVVREATFNVIAVMSTTGFATADFAQWPVVAQVLLLGLMFVGAMGGSTGGGFKVVRAVVLAKHARAGFRIVLHPRAVVAIRLGRNPIRQEVLLNVVSFFALYITTHGVGTILLAAMGYDFTTAVSAALAAMSSVGPGLGAVGPASHYGDLSAPAQIVLSVLMLLGRLEFYTLLILLIPETWRIAFQGDRAARRKADLAPNVANGQ